MTKAQKILELVRNKTKRVNLVFNEKLWRLFEETAAEEGLSTTAKLEDLIINHLDLRKKIE